MNSLIVCLPFLLSVANNAFLNRSNEFEMILNNFSSHIVSINNHNLERLSTYPFSTVGLPYRDGSTTDIAKTYVS